MSDTSYPDSEIHSYCDHAYAQDSCFDCDREDCGFCAESESETASGTVIGRRNVNGKCFGTSDDHLSSLLFYHDHETARASECKILNETDACDDRRMRNAWIFHATRLASLAVKGRVQTEPMTSLQQMDAHMGIPDPDILSSHFSVE